MPCCVAEKTYTTVTGMVASGIGIERTVEGDVGRLVKGDDRFRMKVDHRGPQLPRRAVYVFARVKPVPVLLARGQAEARRHGARLRASAVDGRGTDHAVYGTYVEHICKGMVGAQRTHPL